MLANIAPDIETKSIPEIESVESFAIPPVSSTENTTIPDWLKESTSIGSHADSEDIPPASEDIPPEETLPQMPIVSDVPYETLDTANTVSEENISPETSPELPDWLKGMEATNAVSQDVSIENPTEEEMISEEQKTSGIEQTDTSDETMSELPAWMQ